MKTKTCYHPMLMFWMGVLTGAVLVALTFLYRLYGLDTQTAVYRYTAPLTTTTTSWTQNVAKMVSPTSTVSILDPKGW